MKEKLIYPGDGSNTPPKGLECFRSFSAGDYHSGPVVPYEGVHYARWVSTPETRAPITKLGGVRIHEVDVDYVVLLEPVGEAQGQGILECLGDTILHGKPGWTRTFRLMGDMSPMPAYVEWAKDIIMRFAERLACVNILGGVVISAGTYNRNANLIRALMECWCSQTNTFLMPYGEIGISLWELHRMSGLPITGIMYEEFVPPNQEIISQSFFPSCFRELLYAYQWVLKNSSGNLDGYVTYEQWATFFMTLDTVDITRGYDFPAITRDGVLAGFLTLWLCRFVFPRDRHVIRVEVFGMASYLATGTQISLAPAVLTAIHVGLGDIVNHSGGPSASTTMFPTSFFYGWIASHFRSTYVLNRIPPAVASIAELREIPEMIRIMGRMAADFIPRQARIFVRQEVNFTWRVFSPPYPVDGYLIDTRSITGILALSQESLGHMISLRHSIIPLRMGASLFAEPYNPHRFARQFGYDQSFSAFYDVPRRSANLGILSGYWAHHSSTGTSSRFRVPDLARVGRPLLYYGHHWHKSMHAYFSVGIEGLLRWNNTGSATRSVNISRDRLVDSGPTSENTVDVSRSAGKRPMSPSFSRDPKHPKFGTDRDGDLRTVLRTPSYSTLEHGKESESDTPGLERDEFSDITPGMCLLY